MRVVELFAGIGGFSLGFEWAGMQCVGHVEIEPYAQKVSRRRWSGVPLYRDVKEVRGDEFGRVDLLCGGFPCTDVSVAGKQEGIGGKGTGLFHEIIRIAGVCRPQWIVLENVRNLLSKEEWVGVVFGSLSDLGYNAEWQVISARDCGAPHKRDRVWIVAYPKCERELQQERCESYERGRFGDTGEDVSDALRTDGKRGGSVGGIGDQRRHSCGTESASLQSKDGSACSDNPEQSGEDVADAPRQEDNGRERGNVDEAQRRRESVDASARISGEDVPDADKRASGSRPESEPIREEQPELGTDSGVGGQDGAVGEQGRPESGAVERGGGEPQSRLGGTFDGLSPWLDENWERGVARITELK